MPSIGNGTKRFDYEIIDGKLVITGTAGNPTIEDLSHAFDGKIWIAVLEDSNRIVQKGEKFSYSGQ